MDIPPIPPVDEESKPAVRSLRELVDLVSGRNLEYLAPEGEAGIAEALPFPFLALVGQPEMKLGLLLSLINPSIGGVLLIGPRGTGKTTAVRSLLDLLPNVTRSACFYGCMPEDVESGGIDAICPDCARKYAEGKSLTIDDRVRLVELPLNASLEDVIGGLDERALVHERLRLRRGILAQADRNILFVDEVNLLSDEIIDSILDAAAQGVYTVRRGAVSATYNAHFLLIGSMNPEEGNLRPQIMDRFGLRIIVEGLKEPDERLEAYRRVHAYVTNPRQMIANYSIEINTLREEIQIARQALNQVNLPDNLARAGIQMVNATGIDSLRAEITLFEAARARAVADNRFVVEPEDLRDVAPMALRMRRSKFMTNYIQDQKTEEEEISALMGRFI